MINTEMHVMRHAKSTLKGVSQGDNILINFDPIVTKLSTNIKLLNILYYILVLYKVLPGMKA